MQFTATIRMDNAAFGSNLEEAVTELRRILDLIAGQDGDSSYTLAGNFEARDQEVKIRDLNGNTVGAWSFEDTDDTFCTQCGERNDDGEGFDCLCGSCADKAEEENEEEG